MAQAKIDTTLAKAMNESLKAYAAGDKKFFSFLSDDVRVYTLEDTTKPIVGRKAFESYFGGTMRKMKRKVSIVHQDVQLSGNQAVLAQTLQIVANGVTSHVRQSVVWELAEDGEWYMNHIHNALVGQPSVNVQQVAGKTDPVRVINERIATVAATVGVAQ